MPLFNAIAAMSENRVIGSHGKIPWHIPDDFRWFKHKTMGGTLVMGRKTFESIGKPLPGRKTVVLTRQALAFPGAETLPDASALPQSPGHGSFWICGGSEIYAQLLPACAYLYLTRIKRVVEGDTFMSEFESAFEREAVIHETPEYRIERWKNQKLPLELALPPDVWPL